MSSTGAEIAVAREKTAVNAIEMRGIVKRFPGVLANDRVELTVRRGEIHGLIGENGAGKSTLMNILAGIHRPDEGTLSVLGCQRRFRSASEAIHAGIGMVHQHFMLVPSLSVVDNLILGVEPVRFGGLLRRKEARVRILEQASKHGFQLEPDAVVGSLPVAIQQQIEIMKCLLQNAHIMIFDEPTAVLAPQESDALLETMRQLAAEGRTILLITHKLREVMAVCDRVTVLRDGRVTGTVKALETSERELARLMVGRDIQLPTRQDRHRSVESGQDVDSTPVLEVKGLQTPGRKDEAIGPIDLVVNKGEIVGVAAISGNGQAELVEAIAGLRHVSAGSVCLAGQDVTGLGPRQRRGHGLAYIPQDRRGRGTDPTRTVIQNAVAGHYRTSRLQRAGWLKGKAARRFAHELVRQFAVRTAGIEATGLSLSGGNLQKLVVGRELATHPRLLIAEDPTQGVDIGSVEAIRKELLKAASQGCGILLVSQDLSEVLALSDRIVVLYEGRIAGEKRPGPGAEEAIGLLMTGATST